MNDPLARFQKAQLLAHELSDKKERSSKEALPNYMAFCVMEKTDKSIRLQIRCAAGLTHSPLYSHLLDVGYDGSRGTELVLEYGFMMVIVKGKGLHSMVTALEKHDCAYLQDYDARFFMPPKPNEAIIESIEVVCRS